MFSYPEKMGIKERQDRERHAVRESILTAARDLFVAEGYAQVSIRKIAERIEYSPAAIYSYFPSKDDIFFTLAAEGFQRLDQAIEAVAGAADPMDDLRNCWWAFYQFSKDQREFFHLMFVDRSVPAITEQWQGFGQLQQMLEKVAARIQRLVDAGRLPRHPRSACRAPRPVGGPDRSGRAGLHLPSRPRRGPRRPGPGRPRNHHRRPGRRHPSHVRAVPSAGPAAACRFLLESALMKASAVIAASAAALSLVVSAGCGGSAATPDAAAQSAAAEPAAVDVAAIKATAGTIESALELSGNLAPRARVGLKPRVPGAIERVLVDIGASVREGQPVATIDRREIDAQADAMAASVNVAKAGLESVEATLANAVLELERARNLFEKGALPRQRLDAAETAHQAAVAQRELAPRQPRAGRRRVAPRP